MKGKTKGIFIMSLNSKRLRDAISNKNNFHFNNEVDELDVFVFDTLEILNGIFFNHNNAEKQKDIIEGIINKLETGFVAVGAVKMELIRCSTKWQDLNPFIKFVYDEFYSNAKFESHCRNQIFRNLQPKFKKLSVVNNQSGLIELLIPFLVVEIALYLYIFNKYDYQKIYGMETEMDIIAAIKSDKYPVFRPFLNNVIKYHKINAD